MIAQRPREQLEAARCRKSPVATAPEAELPARRCCRRVAPEHTRSPDDRSTAGKARCDTVSGAAHGVWKKSQSRADPFDLLQVTDADRLGSRLLWKDEVACPGLRVSWSF